MTNRLQKQFRSGEKWVGEQMQQHCHELVTIGLVIVEMKVHYVTLSFGVYV